MQRCFKDKRIENAVVMISGDSVVPDKQLVKSLLESIYEAAGVAVKEE